LVAYVVMSKELDSLSSSLRDELKKTLPTYMIPVAYVALPALPLGPSGKIDRRVLINQAESAKRVISDPPQAGAADDSEATIRAAFEEVLNTSNVPLDVDFFELGGNSLLAVRLVRKLEATLGSKIPLGLLFEHASVAKLAQALRDTVVDGARPRVVALRRGDSGEKLFCIYGIALYQHLAQALPEHLTVYGVYVPIETEIFDPERLRAGELKFPSVKELAGAYVEVMRGIQPKGPYRLLGLSFGGVVAYEIACQLRDAGEEVALLGLLDALLPESVAMNPVRRLMRRAREALLRPTGWAVTARLARARLGWPADGDFSDAQLAWLRDQINELQVGSYARQLAQYPGDVVLVHATDRAVFGTDSVDAARGWRERISGRLSEYRVPGGHLGIVERPNALVLAQRLAAHLCLCLWWLPDATSSLFS
jgi:thioesterase domain-containing protein/acyl carrier protein